MRLVELRDIGFGDAGLLGAGREDGRAVLRPSVRPLAVELGGVVHDRKEDLQDTAIADAVRVEGDLHRLGMPGRAGADRLVLGRVLAAAGIARYRARYA